jgi:REP element-mobilizing transposase RayT
LFGEIVEGILKLNSIGMKVEIEWQRLANHFPCIKLDAFVVMPNHFHGIILIEAVHPSIVRATRPLTDETVYGNGINEDQLNVNLDGSPQQARRPHGPPTNSLGAMIGQFKSRATKRIWTLPGMNRHPIWQRNYYEHIIRNEQEYQRIVQYIESNPQHWQEDQLHSFLPGIREGINHGH